MHYPKRPLQQEVSISQPFDCSPVTDGGKIQCCIIFLFFSFRFKSGQNGHLSRILHAKFMMITVKQIFQ